MVEMGEGLQWEYPLQRHSRAKLLGCLGQRLEYEGP